MIDDLNEYLQRDLLEDCWYYDVIFTCEDIINGFTEDDWKELQATIPNKDSRWKRRLGECLEDIDHPNVKACMEALKDNNMA